jgi:hypothetical protein
MSRAVRFSRLMPTVLPHLRVQQEVTTSNVEERSPKFAYISMCGCAGAASRRTPLIAEWNDSKTAAGI